MERQNLATIGTIGAICFVVLVAYWGIVNSFVDGDWDAACEGYAQGQAFAVGQFGVLSEKTCEDIATSVSEDYDTAWCQGFWNAYIDTGTLFYGPAPEGWYEEVVQSCVAFRTDSLAT